jgi:glycosyltransferase involved in cell wall biosynthesis
MSDTIELLSTKRKPLTDYCHLSVYILTYNSQKYLAQILSCSNGIADELVIIDSGSTDNTLQVAHEFGCKIYHRPFDNFREQRTFALSKCNYNWVLTFDSDEVPSQELIEEIRNLKGKGFTHDAYCIKRNWNVLGKWVHAMYPTTSPDYPIRLINKNNVVFDQRSSRNHEIAHGFKSIGRIDFPIQHYTFETRDALENKLILYSKISAEDLVEQNRKVSILIMLFRPLSIWCKWYLIYNNWKDGYIGIVLANYAYLYTYLKYKKALAMLRSKKKI